MDPHDAPPLPAPDMARRQAAVVSIDVTDKITKAASALSPGQIVKDGFFTLFESVGALEIMDPKMDSACSDPHGEHQEVYDVRQELLPDEVLGIMDQLLCYEMAWHLGYPLSQTLFTSVYVEEILMPTPKTIEDADFIRKSPPGYLRPPLLQILRAYCIGVLKTCGQVVQRVQTESYYEEEDFVSNTYHRTLLDNVETDAVVACMLDARKLTEGLRGSLPDDVVEALEARLQLRSSFLEATIVSQDATDAAGIKAAWAGANSALLRLNATLGVATTSVPASFDARIQQKLASTMPPRPIVNLSREEALGHLERLFQDNLKAVEVVDYSDPESLLTFVAMMQSKKPQPLVYTRCLLQGIIFNDMVILTNKSMRQVMDDDFSMVSMSYSTLIDRANDEIEAPHDPRFLIAQHMEQFRQRTAPVYFEVLRVLCLNRCRVRRTLVHLIREWDGLHGDAEQLDQVLRELTQEEPTVISVSGNPPTPMDALPLSSWACLHKLRLMSWLIQLGFELDVYQKDELAGMYWYLNYLSKQRFQLLERTKGFVDAHARRSAAATAAGARDPRTLDVDRRVSTSLSFLSFSLLDAAVVWDLTDALTALYTALRRLKLVTPPPRPYSTDALRYELRTRPFATVGIPEPVPFDVFEEGVAQRGVETLELLAAAANAAATARRSLESMVKLEKDYTFSGLAYDAWLDRTKGTLRACIALGLAITTLRKMVEVAGEGEVKGKVEIPDSEKSYHPWWIVPRVIPG
ncbi:related to MAK10 Glucose-repressible protein [Cephalotrichum gorgonifer]|uniref:Related to MAK10 Glucose-repressible protein n=1 Tax=Cephalotrichum gorgonifer TaxID=2041049 RepID=A0AAE8MZ22_9PEZI|nr:related to MAK10 Glucose-repressible protein [Cephalotrichum gorgonifer]